MSQSPDVAARPLDTASAKIVLLGESAVGKSSLALRFARNEFFDNQETTIGAAFLTRTVRLPSAAAGASPSSPSSKAPAALKYEIWDTAGQERYRSLAPIYYRGACGALVVYDITQKESFRRAQNWIKELRTNADPSLTILLVGNKKDLEASRQVGADEGEALAASAEVAGFYEASAKDGAGVEQVFLELAARLVERGAVVDPNSRNSGAAGGARRLEADPAAGGGQPAQSNCC